MNTAWVSDVKELMTTEKEMIIIKSTENMKASTIALL